MNANNSGDSTAKTPEQQLDDQESSVAGEALAGESDNAEFAHQPELAPETEVAPEPEAAPEPEVVAEVKNKKAAPKGKANDATATPPKGSALAKRNPKQAKAKEKSGAARKTRSGATAWSAFTAITVVAAFGYLAVGGAQGFNAGDTAKATGTEVTVAAPAVSLVCPNPIVAARGAGSDLGLDELSGGAVKSVHEASVALVGGAGSVSFSSLGLPKDSSSGETPASDPVSIADLAGPTGTANQQSLGKFLLLKDVETSLVATTNKRAVSNDSEQEFTAATMFNSHSAGDSRGISAANCAPAAGEHWLVGGSTAIGNSTKLVVSNPSITPATVKITVWGPSGRIELAGSDTFLISAGSQISTLLEGIAAEQRRLAIHVEAEGAQVSAYLEQSTLDGLTAHGSDYVTSGSGPSRVTVLSGVDIVNVPVDSDAASSIRVAVPDFTPALSLAEQSEEAAADIENDIIGHARIRLLGQDGNIVMFGAQEVELSAGIVQDISLGGAPSGVYSVIIESDVPLVAGATSVKVGTAPKSGPLGTPRDFSWVSSSSVFSNEQHVGRVGYERWVSGEVQLSDELVARSQNGLIAIPSGVDATLSVVGLPQARSVEEVREVLDVVPNVYSALAGSQATAEETDAAQAAAQEWKPSTVATVIAYDSDGSVLGTKELALADGQSRALKLSEFGNVSAVSVMAEDGGIVDWSVALGSSAQSAQALTGATGHLAPTIIEQEPTDLWVSRATQLN